VREREINRKNSKIERVIREREKEFFLLTTYDSFSVLFMGRETERERRKARRRVRTAHITRFLFSNGYKLTYNRVRIPNIIYT
jgi:hypothetical protein